jgi:hypothetical protein
VSSKERRLRRPPFLLPVLSAATCAVVLAACSSSSAPPTKATGTGTATQNLAAHVLNLKSTDFPSTWKTYPATGGPNVVRSSLNGCALQLHAPTPATAAVSSNFLESATGLEIGSQVQVFDHASQAAATATTAASNSLSSCLAAVVKSGLSATLTSKESVTNVTAAPVDPHNSGPHAFAQQVVATISYPGKSGATSSLQVYVLVDGFAHGVATVEGEFENPGSAPPDARVSSTMATLLKRAQG